jgi:hypothetical protein
MKNLVSKNLGLTRQGVLKPVAESVQKQNLKPPPDPPPRWWWLRAALGWLMESVDLVREIGPGIQPLDRHVWEPKAELDRHFIR